MRKNSQYTLNNSLPNLGKISLRRFPKATDDETLRSIPSMVRTPRVLPDMFSLSLSTRSLKTLPEFLTPKHRLEEIDRHYNRFECETQNPEVDAQRDIEKFEK
jgi:hypothetical protein